jgi:hypothetical protein
MTQHLFLHVPKTAGSSIRTLLQQNYPVSESIAFGGDPESIAWYRDLPPEVRSKYRLVHGHFEYGLHEGIADYTYFTLLRDPVARHFSDYFFLKRYSPHPLHPLLASGAISLEDWATTPGRMPGFKNRATRFLSGDGDGREPDRLSVESSKFHLLRDFSFIGLAERFDESVLIMAKRLGWTSVFYLTKNVSERQEVCEELRERTRQKLTLDLELYDFGRRQFEASPELQDPLFAAALVELREVRGWLEQYVANQQNALFSVGDDLPPLLELVKAHRSTPAIDRYLATSPARQQ